MHKRNDRVDNLNGGFLISMRCRRNVSQYLCLIIRDERGCENKQYRDQRYASESCTHRY